MLNLSIVKIKNERFDINYIFFSQPISTVLYLMRVLHLILRVLQLYSNSSFN